MSPETELHVLPMEAVSKPPGGNAIFLAGRGATRPAAHRGAVRRAHGVRGFEATRDLLGGHRPDASWVGIGLAVVTLATMPPLAAAKRRVGEQLGSSATMSESRQMMLCAYLSVALLAGLLANAAMGWWWADPLAALAIAAVAVREAVDAERGKACDCCS